MAEKKVHFETEGLRLEGLLDVQSLEKAVVIAHPHPLFGGDMYNPVVETIRSAYFTSRYTTLRFNFRGVGASEGMYAEGLGEQADLAAALAFLVQEGLSRIDLVGYSFGAWIMAMGLARFAEARRAVMVSPPVSLMDFSFLEYNSKIRLVVTGSEDDIAPAGTVGIMMRDWNPEAELKRIQGADHFYSAHQAEMAAAISDFLG
jgi:alpha/beta superfamily hydrolase